MTHGAFDHYMLNNYDKRLKSQVLDKLTNRAKGGVFSYLIIWLAISFWADLITLFPLFFWINTALFTLGCLSKLIYYIIRSKKLTDNIEFLSRFLTGSILLHGFHWGIINALTSVDPSLHQIHSVMLMTTVGFAMAGTVTFAISNEIRNFYPYLVVLPGIIASLSVKGEESFFIIFLAILALVYITCTAKVVAKDYWSAVHANLLANDRALQLETLTNIDPLTQLNNRLYFDKTFLTEWNKCTRQSSPVSLMMIDLDYFKKVNDTYGHQFGDLCLVEFSKVLSSIISRQSDIVARYGGEEFIVFLPATNLEQSKILAENILNKTSDLALMHEGKRVNLGCSIGIQSVIPNVDTNRIDLIKQADNALYMAKSKGRHRYQIYKKI